MLEHLSNISLYNNLYQQDYQSFKYGYLLRPFHKSQDPTSLKIALLNTDEHDYSEFRKALFQLAHNFKAIDIVDLGQIKGGFIGLTETVDYLVKHKIFPIIIGKDKQVVDSQFRAYEHQRDLLHLTLVDSHLDWSEKDSLLINKLLERHPNILANFSCVGYQLHYCNPVAIDFLKDKFFELFRLSKIQQHLADIEPIVRNTDLLGFNLASIKSSDAPCTTHPNPNGFFATEACKILRYATMSDQLSSLSIFGYDPTLADHGQTAQLVAQLIWYAISGFYARKGEYPVDTDRLTKYVVEPTHHDYPLTFFKSSKSERWWLWVPKLEIHPIYQHQPLIPCSYQDYQKACDGEISARLLRIFSQF
ncbi:MAG: hypothetical protein GY810_09420 [Aureispira sp.]|nr:hypothetical protein [Aureispira sp.]